MPDKVTKFILALDTRMRERLVKKIEQLLADHFSVSGVKKMQGSEKNRYRLRMGQLRIVYEVKEGEVEIIDIDYCGNIY